MHQTDIRLTDIARALGPAVAGDGTHTISAMMPGAHDRSGCFTCYWNQGAGTFRQVIERFDATSFPVTCVPGGRGPNDLALDRGHVAGSHTP